MPTITRPRWLAVLRLAAAALLVGVAAAGAPALAQDEITIDSVLVQVWPEYDQPAALVIVNGRVGEGVSTPVNLTFPLPEGATIHAVAYTEPGGVQPLIAEYTETDGGISVNSPSGVFLVEYYHDAIETEGDTRSYTAVWESPYEVGELIWEIQQPATASNLQVEGGAEAEQTTDNVGLPALRVVHGPVAAGESVALRFSYAKTDNVLSDDRIALPTLPATGQDVPVPVAQEGGPSTLVTVLAMLGGLLLIGGAVVWYLRQTQSPGRGGRRRLGRRESPRGPSRGGAKRFCTNCGESLLPGDRFCRSCGQRVRD